jgi:hypothetical protein
MWWSKPQGKEMPHSPTLGRLLKDARGKGAYETHFNEEEEEANTLGSTLVEVQKPTLT